MSFWSLFVDACLWLSGFCCGWFMAEVAFGKIQVRRALMYMHWLKVSRWLGKEPWKNTGPNCKNVYLVSTSHRKAKGYRIGAWVYHWRGLDYLNSNYRPDDDFQLNKEGVPIRPRNRVVVFFHGRGGARYRPWLRSEYSKISKALDAAVLAIDYRGFGDSEGRPTLNGLMGDARAALRYAFIELGADDIVVWGQSLGSAVAAHIVAETMEQKYMTLMGASRSYREPEITHLVLEAAPTTMRQAFFDFWLHRPLLALMPERWRRKLAAALIVDDWAGLFQLQYFKGTTVLMHCQDDRVVPFSHHQEWKANWDAMCMNNPSSSLFVFTPDTGGHNGVSKAASFKEFVKSTFNASSSFYVK